MSHEQIELAYSQTIENILETIGHSAATFLPLLGERSIEMAVQSVEDYLKLLKNLRHEYQQPTASCMSPLLNDSMLVHRNRLARSSKSRLNNMRNSPSSPMEVDRDSLTPSRAGAISVIAEESTFLDTTGFMEETVHERGFLADVSSLNNTARSRPPSFNFDQISPVSSRSSRRSILPVNSSIDFDADTSSVGPDTTRSTIRGTAGCEVLIVDDNEELRTPRAAHNHSIVTLDDSLTPTNNLWNVTLRSGSNRKISEEIRREIQRQLAREEK